MDYPLNGFYDTFPTVIYYEPTDPAALPHMSIVSAGIHNAGITSYNTAGLFLGSHAVPTHDAAWRGVPAFLTADLAASRSESFDSAAELFCALPSPAGWTYFVAGVKEGKFGTLERTSGRFAVQSSEGECYIQTNRFVAPSMRAHNLYVNASIDEDSAARRAAWRTRLFGRLRLGRQSLGIMMQQSDMLAY